MFVRLFLGLLELSSTYCEDQRAGVRIKNPQVDDTLDYNLSFVLAENEKSDKPLPFYLRGWVIRHATSGLVLDAADDIVTLQTLSSHLSQAWYFEKGWCDGCFLIYNMFTGHVLDIQGGAKEGAQLITDAEKECCSKSQDGQLWKLLMTQYGQNGLITSGTNDDLAMDAENSYVGAPVTVNARHERNSQQFQLI